MAVTHTCFVRIPLQLPVKSMTKISDNDLVKAAIKGDQTAYTELYNRHRVRVTAVVTKLVGKQRIAQDADDIVQLVFVKAFRSLHQYEHRARFSTWLHKIAMREVQMYARKVYGCDWRDTAKRTIKENTIVSLDEIKESHGFDVLFTDGRLEQTANRMALIDAINRLPRGYRKYFLMFNVDGYEHTEIARMTGMSKGVSKSQNYKARQKLKELLCQQATT